MPDHFVAVTLMCVSFAVALVVGFWLLEARGIIQLDVWFHLDTDDLLVPTEFSELVRHPNLGLFVRRPVLLATRLLGALGIGGSSPLELFYWLMLLVAPAAAALRTCAAYYALRRSTQNAQLAALLCLLEISAFATVAVGSVPESYPLSAACLAGLYWLLASDRPEQPVRWGRWLAVGTLAVGITITNLVPFAILLGSLLLIRGLRLARVVSLTALSLVAVAAATGALVLASALLIGEPLGDRVDPSTEKYMGWTAVGDAAAEVTWAMAHTFIAPPAHAFPGTHTASDNPDHDYVLLLPTATIRDPAAWWRGLLPVPALLLGVAGFVWRRTTALWAVPAAAILASNLGLHLFFGHHYFMYAMHWAFSMVWLMSGAAFLPRRARFIATAMIAFTLLVTAINSAMILRQLLAHLRAA